MAQEKVLFVYFDGEQVAEPTLMGKLMGTRVRGKVLYSIYRPVPENKGARQVIC